MFGWVVLSWFCPRKKIISFLPTFVELLLVYNGMESRSFTLILDLHCRKSRKWSLFPGGVLFHNKKPTTTYATEIITNGTIYVHNKTVMVYILRDFLDGHISSHTRCPLPPSMWARPTKNWADDKAVAAVHITNMTYFERSCVKRCFNGNVTTRKRSTAMAIFVNTLAATEIICIDRTIGQTGSEKIHILCMASAKVKGIQNNPINKSAMAKLIRKWRKSVRDRFPLINTTITKRLPTIARTVVNAYRTVRPIKVSPVKFKMVSPVSFVLFSKL